VLKVEKETIFRLNSAEPDVAIYSCHPHVWRRLERKGYKPVKSHVRADREIARSYRVQRNCFRFGVRAANQPRRPAPTGAFRSKKPEKTTRK